MKSIVRGFNKDKHQSAKEAPRPAITPLPNDPSKKMPPKGIIRAIDSFSARNADELSCRKGDFFHLLAEQPGPDGQGWFDATNPLTGARGLVPKEICEILGKTSANKPAGASPSNGIFGMQDLASAVPGATNTHGGNGGGSFGGSSPQTPKTPNSATSNGKAQSLYARVQYDFEAQRPDELDARRGENIIVIAQSNHEWFVAKPIGRLGGPGLIPVSYVEVLNMATGKPLDPATVSEMVRGGALPAVEEWKKTTAEYKQRSIPLGRFDFGQAPSQAAGPSRTSTSSHADPSFSHQRSASQASMRQRTGSFASQQQLPPRSSSSAGHLTESAHDPYFSQQNSTANTTPPAPYDSDDASRFGLIEAASVDSFHQEEGAFWFLMRCNFTSNYSLVLYRSYEDFYEFQMSLMDDMPVEAGREAPPGSQGPPRRIIPRLPGPVEHVDHVTCAQRQVDLTVYLRQLCGLPDYVRSHFRFYEFFLPRSGDVEVSPPSEDFVPQHQAENDIVEYLDRMPGSNGNSPDAEAQQHPQRYSARESQQMRHSASRESYGAAGYGPSDSTPRPGSTSAYQNGRSSRASNNSSVHGASVSSMRSPAGESSGSPWAQQQPPPAFVKIKIFHRNTDDLIAIRVPPGVSRKALLEKTRERLGNDVVKLRYREDIPPEERIGSTSARLVELHSDEDLKAWLQSGKKQVLYVD